MWCLDNRNETSEDTIYAEPENPPTEEQHSVDATTYSMVDSPEYERTPSPDSNTPAKDQTDKDGTGDESQIDSGISSDLQPSIALYSGLEPSTIEQPTSPSPYVTLVKPYYENTNSAANDETNVKDFGIPLEITV